MSKKIILTRQQLNEVLNEVTGVYKSTTPGAAGVVDAIKTNLPQINKLNSIDGSSVPQTLIQTPTVNGQDADEKPVVQIDTKGDPSQASTIISQNSDLENALNTNKVNGLVTEKNKSFSKRQIEEARLRKIREEGIVISKGALSRSFLNEWEEKPNDDANQWNEELKMFMDGLRHGDYEVMGDTLFVQIFKGRTSDNDPRFVYIRKGENRLHDDHFYIQNSPPLEDSDLKDIYYNAGWEDVLPELIDYDNFEMYESKSKIKIKPENKGKFNATKKRTGKSTEELTHSKNPLTRKRAIFAQNAKKWKKK